MRGDPDDWPRHHGNRDGGHRRRSIRLHRQALRTGSHAEDREARRSRSIGERSDDVEGEDEDLPESEMIGSSAAMVDIYKTISRVAPTDATVLIEGETGTGKELIARMIHRYSLRADHPFVPVDCGSIAPSLLESELFGALKGAYTGADRDRIGVFEAANNGTVFLDEIGDVDLGFQLKLFDFYRSARSGRSAPRDLATWMSASFPPPIGTCRSWWRKANSARISGFDSTWSG